MACHRIFEAANATTETDVTNSNTTLSAVTVINRENIARENKGQSFVEGIVRQSYFTQYFSRF
jgi:hypothetical protein